MTEARQLTSKVRFHPKFTTNECTFTDGNNGVIFSPATSETLLCECSILDYIKAIEADLTNHATLSTANLALSDDQRIIIEKLLHIRVLLPLNSVSPELTRPCSSFSALSEE